MEGARGLLLLRACARLVQRMHRELQRVAGEVGDREQQAPLERLLGAQRLSGRVAERKLDRDADEQHL